MPIVETRKGPVQVSMPGSRRTPRPRPTPRERPTRRPQLSARRTRRAHRARPRRETPRCRSDQPHDARRRSRSPVEKVVGIPARRSRRGVAHSRPRLQLAFESPDLMPQPAFLLDQTPMAPRAIARVLRSPPALRRAELRRASLDERPAALLADTLDRPDTTRLVRRIDLRLVPLPPRSARLGVAELAPRPEAITKPPIRRKQPRRPNLTAPGARLVRRRHRRTASANEPARNDRGPRPSCRRYAACNRTSSSAAPAGRSSSSSSSRCRPFRGSNRRSATNCANVTGFRPAPGRAPPRPRLIEFTAVSPN